MTDAEVLSGAVEFLDQFIGRGAESSVIDARRSLAEDAAAFDRLIELAGRAPDERRAFDALRAFLEERVPKRSASQSEFPDLSELVSWMTWDGIEDDQTADPAQWDDWLSSVARFS